MCFVNLFPTSDVHGGLREEFHIRQLLHPFLLMRQLLHPASHPPLPVHLHLQGDLEERQVTALLPVPLNVVFF